MTANETLIDIFWSHVRLGQWEQAKGAIQLIKSTAEDQCKDLLTVLILQPKNHSLGSKSVPTPFHLSWLALQELKNNNILQDDTLSTLPIKELEFDFLLHHLTAKLSPEIKRELVGYHTYINKTGDSEFIAPRHLSAAACDFLSDLIRDEPLLALCLIESLLGKIEKFSLNDFSLLQILTNKAGSLITELSQCEPGNFETIFENAVKVLSFIKPHLEWGDPLLIQQYSTFIKKTIDTNPKLVKQTWSTFIHGAEKKFLQITHELEEKYHLENFAKKCTENDSPSIENVTDLLSSDSEADLQTLFLYFYQNKTHILEYAIEGCLDLVHKGDFERVTHILSFPLFAPLKPLILLIAWTSCTSFNQAEALLKHLLQSENEVCGILSPACKKLIYQAKLIKWCLVKAREILGEKLDNDALLNVLFKQLDHSSVLFILNETKLLRTLQYKEVVDLLQQQTEIHESYNSMSEQHIVTFLCYTIIKKYIDLLISSKTGKFINESNVEVEFTTDVMKEQIAELKTFIEKIASPDSKIEVLENIFSLLFIRSSDYKGFEREDIDFDNIEDSSRDSSMSQSIDSNIEDDPGFFMKNEIKKAQRSLIFTEKDLEGERKLISKDDINAALLQEIQDGSSSDTLKAKEHLDDLEQIQDMSPSFLANADLIKTTLELISDCLVSLSVGRFSTSKADGHKVDATLDYRISSLQAHTREGQWRLQLISGMNLPALEMQPTTILGFSNDHVISRMLGSSQSLVYLTLKKGDFIQAKQVIKMFNLKDQFCSLEMEFTEKIEEAHSKLKLIRSVKQKKDHSFSSMDFVKSAASAGKLSSEVNQIIEELLHHGYLSDNKEIEMSSLALAVCVDLMYSTGISVDVAKRLVDMACLKMDGFNLELPYKSTILEKAKQIKSILNLMLNRDFEIFKLCGDTIPEDFLQFVLLSPLFMTSYSLEFQDNLLVQGKNAFKILVGTINVLQSTVQELREPRTTDSPDVSLKETENNLLTVLSSDAVSQFNQTEVSYDYLKSLFRYVKHLAGLKLYFETRSDSEKEGGTQEQVRPLKVANPYLIFNEKISSIFGRLLFDWNVSPKKLEMFAKQSGVNLVKVITENCGVNEAITKTRESSLLYQIVLMDPIILNGHTDDSSATATFGDDQKSPNDLVEEILTQVLDMVAETGDDTPLSPPEVCQVLNISSKQLQRVNTALLQTKGDCLCFFINLFNLMFLHSIMLIASDRFHQPLALTISKLYKMLETAFGRNAFFHLISYNVGQLGRISAFDVYNHLLMHGKENDLLGLWRKRKVLPASSSLSKDTDVRSMFLLSFGTIHCPSMQVMNTQSFETMLKSSTMEYLDSHIKIDQNKSQVHFPEIIQLHRNNFIEPSQQPNEEGLRELMSVVIKYAGPSLKTKLQQALDEEYEIIITKHIWSCRYPLCRDSSNLKEEDQSPKMVDMKFATLPPRIKEYMKNSYPLAGTFIEVFVVKNSITKETGTVFNNNILCSISNKKDAPLNIVSSLKNGITVLTKICSDDVILRNFVVESCSYIINILELVSSLEQSLDIETRKDLFKSLENALSNEFLTTLSTDSWSHLLPSLIVACLQTGNCHRINMELLALLNTELFDLVVVSSVHELKNILINKYKLYVDSSDPLAYELKRFLLLVHDAHLRCELCLDVVRLLSAQDVFDLLTVCLEKEDQLSLDLQKRVTKQIKETKWCHQVYNMCMLSTMSDAFTCWQDVEGYVNDDPDYVTWFLNDTHAYELMDIWFDLHELPNSNQQRCIQAKVLHILKEPYVTELKIQNCFSRSKSDDMSLKICRNVISAESKYHPNRQLILSYMLNNLKDKLLESEKKNCLLNQLGIYCIEALPEGLRESYIQLQHKPILILEQLLMNLKVKVASKVIAIIQREIGKDQLLTSLSGQCDDLLGRYAKLAIKLETINRDNDDAGSISPVMSSKEQEFRERKSSTSSFNKTQGAISGEKSMEFIPPSNSAKKEEWVKDEKVSSCMNCHQAFSMFNRRHHCRHCGRVVCATCSTYFCLMAGFQRKERACRPCYYYLENIPLPNEPSSKFVRSQSMDRTVEIPSPPPMQSMVDMDWFLSADESENVNVLEDFRFEQAPNASLCLAIVDLYSNSKAACGLLLKFCNDLSQYLQGPNPEVDVSIVSGMIEFILNQAKLKFMKNSDFGGVELCDTHLSRVEILKLLLESNWHDIPTMQEFAQPETLRRLRDKLMEGERSTLALEITSKCGLDATPVHFLMGVSRLKCGHLEKAREHLSRCLTRTSGESTTSFGPNHHYLQRIIDVIENTPLIALYQSPEGASISLILQDQLKNGNMKCTLDSKRYTEIVYYLKEYGSHGHMIKFFVRNYLINDAVLYIREKKCSHELFTVHVLQTSFKDGSFEELCEKIRANDPSFKFWMPYFAFACKHLEKHGNFHSLYEVQLFIRDFFRAALTCVRFYLGTAGRPPTSYSDLSRRLVYLQKAAQHLEHLIKERTTRSSFVSHVGSSFLGDDKAVANQEIPTSKLKQHLNTVNLQNDVTIFLNTKASETGARAVSPTGPIPTLFGNGKERTELIVSLIIRSVDEALPLASRIIQEFKLPSSPIFGRAAVRLAHDQKYSRVTSVLQNIEKNGMINTVEKDDILLKVIKVLVQKTNAKDAAQFIKQIRGEPSKINAFIICGRLRDAYLEAVKKERVNEIQRILDAARQATNQKSMVDICEKWLKNYHENQLRKEQALNQSKASR